MRIRYSIAACILVLGLIMASLVVYLQPLGGVSPDTTRLDALASRMSECPQAFGDWESVPMPLSDEEFALSQLLKQNCRLFTNQKSGAEMLVYVVLGKGRYATMHSLDFSYRYGGFSLVDRPSVHEDVFGDAPVEFVGAVMQKTLGDTTQRVGAIWSFSDDGRWRTPQPIKQTLGPKDAVAKVYVIASGGEEVTEVACIDFARDYLPLLSETLFGQSSADAKTPAGR